MTYVYGVDAPPAGSLAERTALLGGKAANLSVMAVELNLPVPPAFTIGTAACTTFLAHGWPDGLEAEIRTHLAAVERRAGRRLGDPSDPLLVSVRSGAPVSMPGMMDTILNLGLNDETTRGLAAVTGSLEFAADCRRRFEEMYTAIVGVAEVPEDPWEQLRAAIEAVFGSWNSERAQTYREREAIPHDLGTAVTVQVMVFGNRGPDSGSGVLFTRDPATGAPTLYGDVMFGAQGEDVVAGTHATQSLDELAARLPDVARELEDDARALERYHVDMCDIEFTIEAGRLWLLQCRIGKRSPAAAVRIAVDMAEADDFPLTRRQAVERVRGLLADPPRAVTLEAGGEGPLATGLPASPGVAAGEIATSADAAIAAAETGRPVILVRPETSPDDVRGMARATGLVTALGGLASHAAVVARGWGIPAVVGAASIQVEDDGVTFGATRLAVGSSITVNGSSGQVFAGMLGGTGEILPAAERLLRWAHELGMEIGSPTAEADAPSAAAPSASDTAAAVDRETLLLALAVKGNATPGGLAEALFASVESVEPALQSEADAGLVEAAAGAYRLTPSGREAADRMVAEDRAGCAVEHGETMLVAFHELDLRMKEIVTAWQLRDVDGSQALNDHSDPAYDAGILVRLRELHADTVAWLAPYAASVPRVANYRDRLERAFDLAAGGDQRYVASPRVDSYHSAWFELHELLIRLSGRTREEEVAADRA